MITLYCLFCKKSFTDVPSRVKTRKTCSHSCQGKYYLTGRKKTKQHRINLRRSKAWENADKILEEYKKGDAIMWLAKRYECDKRTIRDILKEKGMKRFRGRKGIKAWNKGLNHLIDERIMKWSRANSPFWRGGITEMTIRIRSNARSREWAKNVIKKDNFTCGLCGKKGGNLEADHYPKMFCDIITENQIKTLADAFSCKELWDMKNGRALCDMCHKRETQKQMKSFRLRRTK